jgi:hypothetical protein
LRAPLLPPEVDGDLMIFESLENADAQSTGLTAGCRSSSRRTRKSNAIPDANFGADSPLSAGLTANLRTAVIRMLIEIGPRPQASSATRGRLKRPIPDICTTSMWR